LRKAVFVIIFFCLIAGSAVSAADFSIRTVRIYGNTRTKERVILERLRIKAGKTLSDKDFIFLKRFFLKEYFVNNIEFRLKPEQKKGDFSLLVIAEERGIISFNPIIGDNNVFGLYGGLGVDIYNIIGYGNSLNLLFQTGGVDKRVLSLGNKWFGPGALFWINAGYSDIAFPYLFTDVESSERLDTKTVYGSFGIHLTKEVLIGFEAGREKILFGDASYMISKNIEDDISFYGITGRIDTRDWPFYPSEGVLVTLDYKNWLLSGSYLFKQMNLELRSFSHLKSGSIVAIRVKMLLSQGDVPFYKRIHFGGGGSLRGYRIGSVFGDDGFLLSAEYRMPFIYIRKPFSGMNTGVLGVIFIDSGSAWFKDQEKKERVFHTSAGFGIHLVLGKWVLRAEYGYHGQGIGFLSAGTGVMF